MGASGLTQGRAERRLAAILAADVIGYSRLVEQDEAATLAALRDLRRGALDPLLAEHRGRVVKLLGDGTGRVLLRASRVAPEGKTASHPSREVGPSPQPGFVETAS